MSAITEQAPIITPEELERDEFRRRFTDVPGSQLRAVALQQRIGVVLTAENRVPQPKPESPELTHSNE